MDDENEEKLVDGMCIECGSTGAAGSGSTSLSLVFRKPRPNGHPIGISSFWELMPRITKTYKSSSKQGPDEKLSTIIAKVTSADQSQEFPNTGTELERLRYV